MYRSRNISPVRSLALAICLWIGVVQIATAQNAVRTISDDEQSALSAWLQNRRLDGLSIDLLEQQIQRTVNQNDRESIAVQLAPLYRSRLLASGSIDTSIPGRAQSLIRDYPVVDTYPLQLAILHGRYRQIETQLERARASGKVKVSARADTMTLLDQLIEDLANFSDALRERSESLFAARQSDPDASASLDREIDLAHRQQLHGRFLLGWACYFRASLTDKANQSEWLTRSEASFREFLEIEPSQAVISLTEKWFTMSNPWTVRAMIGLANVAHQRGADRTSDYLYQMVKTYSPDARTRQSVLEWRFRHAALFGDSQSCLTIATELPQQDLDPATKVRLWLLIWSLPDNAGTLKPDIVTRLQQLAALGLVRHRQSDQLARLLGDAPVTSGGKDFAENWLAGYLDLEAARRDRTDRDRLPSAKTYLDQALAAEPSDAVPGDRERCRYSLAWTEWMLGDVEEACHHFQQASEPLRTIDRELAADSLWQSIRCLSQLAEFDAGRLEETYVSIEQMLRQFPQTEWQEKAAFERLRLENRSLPARAAIDRLSAIGPRQSSWRTAQLEIVATRYHELIDNPDSNSNESAEQLKQLLSAHEQLIVNLPDDPAQRLQSTFLVIDALLRIEPTDEAQLDTFNRAAKQLADQIPPTAAAQAKFHYYQMQLAQRRSDADASTIEANWLMENAVGTRFEVPALIQMANRLDHRISLAIWDDCQRSSKSIHAWSNELLLLTIK